MYPCRPKKGLFGPSEEPRLFNPQFPIPGGLSLGVQESWIKAKRDRDMPPRYRVWNGVWEAQNRTWGEGEPECFEGR